MENYVKDSRKIQLPKLDKKPTKEPNYIDNFEQLFINLYLVNDDELYIYYIENKKSLIHLNINIFHLYYNHKKIFFT